MPKAQNTNPVDVYLQDLDHPLKPLVIALRKCILGTDPQISEEIKWNVPSFRTTEHFATLHLRASDQISVILHLGAKKRAATQTATTVNDPQSLLKWLGKDRAMIAFKNEQDLAQKQAAFVAILHQWIKLV